MSLSTIHLGVQLHVEHPKESRAEVTLRLQFEGPSEGILSLPLPIPHCPQPHFTITLISPDRDSLSHSLAVMSTIRAPKRTNCFGKYLSYGLQHTNPSPTRDPNQYLHSIAQWHADTSIWVQKHYRNFHAVPGFV